MLGTHPKRARYLWPAGVSLCSLRVRRDENGVLIKRESAGA